MSEGWILDYQNLAQDRHVIEQAIQQIEQEITQTEATTVDLNLHTFHTISQRFSTFCKTLVFFGCITQV